MTGTSPSPPSDIRARLDTLLALLPEPVPPPSLFGRIVAQVRQMPQTPPETSEDVE